MSNDAHYEKDFFEWTQQQAQALRRAANERVNTHLDWENIAEEIESLGKRDRNRATSFVRKILEHLLKLKLSPAVEPRRGWKNEIASFRNDLELSLDDSPSLRARVPEWIVAQWPKACKNALLSMEDHDGAASAQAVLAALGQEPIFTVEQVLSDDFYPSFDASPEAAPH